MRDEGRSGARRAECSACLDAAARLHVVRFIAALRVIARKRKREPTSLIAATVGHLQVVVPVARRLGELT
jgi:hypothetical protein